MSSPPGAAGAKDRSPCLQDGHEIADVQQPPEDDHDKVDGSSSDVKPLDEGLARPNSNLDEAPLSTEDAISLFKGKIEEEVRRMRNNHFDVSDLRQLASKMTLDLTNSRLDVVPENVVNMIKDKVARLSLQSNQLHDLPFSFSKCTIRYLNLRRNRFKKIPQAVYKLTRLQILDVSRNNITDLSQDVVHLTDLQVLAIHHNQLHDLPTSLSTMSRLHVLTVRENPLTPFLQHIVQSGMRRSDMTEREREAIVTSNIKTYLDTASPQAAFDSDQSEESGLVNLDPIGSIGDVSVVEGHYQPQRSEPPSFARYSDLRIIEEHPNTRPTNHWQSNVWDAEPIKIQR